MTAGRLARHDLGRLAGWLPVGLLVAAALVPPLRLPTLAVVGSAAATVLARSRGRRPRGPGAAWLAVLPVALSLAVGLLPDPRVAQPGSCDDLLAPPVVRRVLQAALVVGIVALLAGRLGSWRALGVRLPPDRRVTLLAALCPALVPAGLVIGPLLAGPFFGDVRLGPPSVAALLPATIMAFANAAIEEAAYRGAIQRWGAVALGRRGAIVAQALVFGSAHLGADVAAGAPLLWLGMIGAGLVAGLVADRTQSLLLPTAAHVALDVPLALALTCRIA